MHHERIVTEVVTRVMREEKSTMTKLITKIASAVITIGILLTLVAMWGCPNYRVWQQQKEGEAELKRAEQNRQVKVYEAEAALQSAKLQAQAEVERAKGVAEANKIIANGLQGHDEYLRYLWIDKVAGSAQREIVYVPTEANIPVLESTRMIAPKPAQ